MTEKLVIIGNGMAPGRMLEHLFERDRRHYEVTIFNAEPRVNYDRIMLSPVLSGEKDYEEIIIHGDGWYIKNGIVLYKGHKVVGIDRAAKTLKSNHGVVTRYDKLGIRKAELFTYNSADGQTTLHGIVQFPSNFDASRKSPVLVQVYGGPGSASNTARETFVVPSSLTELGFLVVNLDSRSAPGRGKRTLDQVYLKLGQVEIDDMAAGVRSLASRPYVDAGRIGMFGTSYGGYSSVMSLLRHPDVYAAASASSPVTAWHHYDSIYTERYMWILQENKAGYDAGSAMTHARNLKGRLMLYWGTADNNVHPSNMMQLISALQAAGKSFDVQVGPDRGHSGINTDRMMEFFIEALKVPSGS